MAYSTMTSFSDYDFEIRSFISSLLNLIKTAMDLNWLSSTAVDYWLNIIAATLQRSFWYSQIRYHHIHDAFYGVGYNDSDLGL